MIYGKNVLLRPIEERDLEALAAWLNDPYISALVVGWTFPVSLAEQRNWYQRAVTDARNKRWMVDTLDGETIGVTGLWELDYQSGHALSALKIGRPNLRGKGLGTDASLALMAYAFYEVGLNRLWSELLAYNLASYRMYVERCGWKVEGVLRQHVLRGGHRYDVVRVGCLREDFDRLPAADEYRTPRRTEHVVMLPEHMAFDPRQYA